MEKLILVRYGEIILKGGNRRVFEDKLIENIRNAISHLGDFWIKKSQARIYIFPKAGGFDIEEAVDAVVKIFGIVSVSIVEKTESDMDKIKEKALCMIKGLLMTRSAKTFKVESRRGNKSFPHTSPEISGLVGGFIYESLEGKIDVDVNHPDIIIYLEVRDETYIYSEKIPAQGGMPCASNGRGLLLLSGGIDSPVAGFMMAKRGLELECIHYYSYPYTSERAKDKVIELARLLSEYCYRIKLHVIPFTDIQVAIKNACPADELVIIMRRVMMEMAEKVAHETGCQALITGEALGQVASQTIMSLNCTNAAVEMPVFRPLIGMDKDEVVTAARKIGTFETSILPYEDCCTIFVAKHPKTKPVLDRIKASEKNLHVAEMIEKSIAEREVILLKQGKRVDEFDRRKNS